VIEWISSWAQQVIVAIVIATLLEMILPNGNNKKYIKTVIGIYVLFVIISPIISKGVSGKLIFDEFKYEDYFKNDTIYNNISNEISNKINTNVEQTYITSLKQDIIMKLENKGFVINEINMEVDLNDDKNYGMIKYITMSVLKKIESQENDDNIKVNEIQIGNTYKSKQFDIEKANNITASEERQIKDYIKEEYGIKKENIIINQKEG